VKPASGILRVLEEALRPSGILLRGVVQFGSGEGPALSGGGAARSVVLLGNAGGSIWPSFEGWHRENDVENPLDTWSKAVIGPIAGELGATPFYPSDPPYMPFQQWAMRAEGLKASPLGILIHPRYGLWHGYRAALGFAQALDADSSADRASPCDDCGGRPCLGACPAGAISMAGFAVQPCRAYLATKEGTSGCMVSGCVARNACPVGAQYRYGEAQLRFHMAALFG
jgi:ferredoxin